MSDGTVQMLEKKITNMTSLIKPASWIKTIDFIRRLILNSNIMVSILGEEKNGKTVFASLLQTSIKDGTKSYLITAKPHFNSGHFISELSALVATDEAKSLPDIFKKINHRKLKTLLIIDDAHNLSEEFIEEILSELKKQGQEGHVFVCLVSDFSVVTVLNRLAKSTYRDMIHSIEMPPFNEYESNAYVAQNLFKTFHRKAVSQNALRQFYQMTGGHLAHINRQLPSFINDKINHLKNGQRSKGWMSQMGIAASIFLAIIGIAYLTEPEVYDTISVQQVSPVKQPVIEPVLSSYIPKYRELATEHILVTASVKRPEVVVKSEEDQYVNESMAVIDKVVVAPKVLSHPKPSTIASIAPTKKVIKKAITPIPAKSNKGFTIQLVATHNKQQLQHFINDHQLKGKTEIHRTLRAGKDWYVLTLGAYSEQQLAKQVAYKLPKEVTQFKPWVRQISEIKDVG